MKMVLKCKANLDVWLDFIDSADSDFVTVGEDSLAGRDTEAWLAVLDSINLLVTWLWKNLFKLSNPI